MPEILRNFMIENKLDANILYEELRYPSPNFDLIRNYSSLKYQDKEGVPFFKDLADDIDSVLRESVKMYYCL
ncbi:MAG: hypothetical protein L6428_09620 [Candidatus Aminicenantes bacterium]|nr:hypothetical protein [Acidobacteriota bacterium]MCG2811703.1 hypothetical protein [Candidatus Aminicenantes bacterium]